MESSFGSVLYKVLPYCLISPSRFPIFPIANFLWKEKVPHKVRAFVCTMALGKINTNDMLQKRMPGSAISMTCVCFVELRVRLLHIYSFNVLMGSVFVVSCLV